MFLSTEGGTDCITAERIATRTLVMNLLYPNCRDLRYLGGCLLGGTFVIPTWQLTSSGSLTVLQPLQNPALISQQIWMSPKHRPTSGPIQDDSTEHYHYLR